VRQIYGRFWCGDLCILPFLFLFDVVSFSVAPILRLMMKTDEFRGDSRDHREVNKRCGLFH
ncbi:hypothetical protein, partial [Duncaniella muris]|uniref:hypothetical protein n=1 Tax=Duncaniella muris TaxID=2094150 RepID=UPI0025B52B56